MFSEKNDLICPAFVEARSVLQNPARKASANYGKYAKLEDITALVNPILAQHGLTFTQTVKCTSTYMRVRTTLIHKSGQIMFTDSPPMQFGPKPTPQSVGGLNTYAKRYGLLAMLGIEQDLDDDGQTAMKAYIDGDEQEEPKAKAKPKPKPAKPTIIEEAKAPEPPSIPDDKALNDEAVEYMKAALAANELTLENAINRIKAAGKIASPEQMAELEAA